jgi:hypothetical protein
MNLILNKNDLNEEPVLLAGQVLADSLAALAYLFIPLAFLYFIKQRSDIKFRGIFLLFSLFMLNGALVHLISLLGLWWPVQLVEGWARLALGLIAAYTAYRLWRTIPEALHIPSPVQLESANLRLEAEVKDNGKTRLELQKLNRELEERVQKRTQELERSLGEIKRLQGTMTTICAWTKRVKDQGEWISFEEFMNKHLGLQFTHGISEDGVKALRQDFPSIAQDMRAVTANIARVKPVPASSVQES